MKKSTALFVGFSLFFFANTAHALKGGLEGGYKDGFYLQSDDGEFKLKTNLLIQPQHQFLSIEGQGKTNTFQIRRGRLMFSGNAFGKQTTFKFQFQAVGGATSTVTEAASVSTFSNLRDAYVDHKFNDSLVVRFGQFKPYFNFEELTSASNLQFVDRGLANESFTFGRDLGVALHGKLMEKKWEYALFLTNEENGHNRQNLNDGMLFGGRFVYNLMGENEYTQSDVSHSEDPNIALGVAANWNRPQTAAGDNTVVGTTGDVTVRTKGFSFIGAGYYFKNRTLNANIFGMTGQAGYFLTEKFEVAGRFNGVIATTAGAINGYESGVGFNYFIHGHNLKLQTDYNYLTNSALRLVPIPTSAGPTNIPGGGAISTFVQNQNDHRVRTQLQLYF